MFQTKAKAQPSIITIEATPELPDMLVTVDEGTSTAATLGGDHSRDTMPTPDEGKPYYCRMIHGT